MNRHQIYSQILADDFIDGVKDKGEALSDACWGLAYDAKIALVHLEKIKGVIVRGETSWSSEFCDAVLSMTPGDLLYCMATDAGVSFYKLRDCCYVADFFSKDTIEQYGEILPFSYFEFAKSTGYDNALVVLRLAEHERHKRGGKNCGLDWLKMQFHNAAGDPGVADDSNAVIDFDETSTQYYDENDFVVVASAENDPVQSGPLRAPIWYMVTSADRVFTRLRRNILDVDIDHGMKQKLTETIDLILSLIQDLKQEFGENV